MTPWDTLQRPSDQRMLFSNKIIPDDCHNQDYKMNQQEALVMRLMQAEA